MTYIYFNTVEDKDRGRHHLFESGAPYSLFQTKKPGTFLYETVHSVLEKLVSEKIPFVEVEEKNLGEYLSPQGLEYLRGFQQRGGAAGALADLMASRNRHGAGGNTLTPITIKRLRKILGSDT